DEKSKETDGDDSEKSKDSEEDGDEKKEPEKKVDEREAWADAVDESVALQLTDNGEEDYEFSGGRFRGPQGQLAEDQEAYLDILQTGEFEDFLPGDDDKKDDGKEEVKEVKEGKKDEESKDTEEEDDKPEEPKKSRPSVTWSQDSTAFYATRRDSRDVEELFLVNSLSTPRPTLESYSYPLPGEENIRRSELYVFDRSRKTLFRVDPVWKDEGYSNVHWGKTVTRDEDDDEDDDEKKEGEEAEEEVELDYTGTGDTLRFLRRDRLVRNVEFCSLDTRTSECTTLIEEGFQRANISTQSVRYLKDRDELVWWSERSGWGHFYLYSRDGKFKNAITSGPFRASRIVEVDEDKGLLYFRGNAREEGENLYYDHLYRVFLDGTGLTLLDPGDATHRSDLSPTRNFLVDNCSRVDMAPISRVCDAEGNEVMKLEESDLSRLYAAGWTMPETFAFKAADGITDLYGNLWKPFDFDPTKKYAVIAEVYPGPQMEGVSHSFSTSHGRQQLAQLGFLVVQLGHRGGTPGRSKAYHSYGYFNLRDYGLADKKAGLEQLAEQRPYVDINRIGIYGHSGGGFMTAAALMQEPYNDFFKVGVSSSGNHDNNVYGYYWAERYHGLREVEVEQKEEERSRSRSRGRGEAEARDDEGDDKEEKKDDTKVDGDGQKKDGEKDGKKVDDDGEKKDGEETEEEKEAETRFQIQVPSNAELAANLKGHLLLVHGDMDNNVHPAGTMRLVDALIRENKRFDMLIIPGKRHGYGDASSYFTQRKWDYFVEHLMGHSPVSADIKNKD
ncbi:MAG: prolyl oligopeptidase family serine peptidase, partial [Planctomycetota bacterium]|nr:prolyl oligopeptidase family serine peptidase [Planctomycetota bacterium]